MDLWVGIDPGKRGAISAVDRKGKLQHCLLLHGDPLVLIEWLATPEINIRHVFLEKAQSITGQGISGVFTYGEGYGQLQGVLLALKVPFTLVPPRQWQKEMFIGTKVMRGKKKRDPKDRALEAANRVFLKGKGYWLPTERHSKPHDGMIDSALIAEACRRAIG